MATTESNSVTEGTAVDENAAAGAGDIQDSRSADAPRGIPKACVFVANLRAETDEAIIELFQTYGPILRVKTHRDPSSTRTFAFIQYHSIADADAAIEQTNGKTFWGRPLRVERAKVQRTLFLAKLPKSMSEADLREIVQTFGPVEKVTIIINHQTQQSKGCGFVKFEFREDAIAAVEGLRNSRRRWIVEWSTSTHDLETPPPDKHAIFIGNLPASATKESVEARFSVYGTIDNITFVQRQPRSDGEGGPDSPTSSPAGADHDAVSPGPDHPSAAAPAAGSPGSPPLAAAPGSPSSSSSSSSAAAAAVSGSASAAAGGAAGSDESGGAGRRISPAFAFVRFADAAAAAAAIDQQDGAVWEQCRLRCESADSKTSKRNKAAQRLMAPPGHQQFRRQPGFPYPRGGPGGKFDRSGDHPSRYHQDPRGAPHYHSDPAAGTQYDHRRGQRAGYPPRSHHSGSSGPRHSGSSSGGPGQPPPNYHPWPKAPASRASYQHYWSPRSYPPGYIFPTSIGVYPSPAPPPPGGNVKYAYHPSSPPPKKQDPPADAADPAAAAAAAAAAPRGSFFPPPAFSVEPYDSSQPWPNYPRNPPHSRRHYSPESDASQGKW